MKLKFEASLDYQTDAVNAVVDIFKGERTANSVFTVTGNWQTLLIDDAGGRTGISNDLHISDDEVFKNLNEIQSRNGAEPTISAKDMRRRMTYDALVGESSRTVNVAPLDLGVEMETGTGKTYVYTKTIMELNKRYDFKKFIIVVPSIAIKEGVDKSLQITKEHFKSLYNGMEYTHFVYNSKKLDEIRAFAVNSGISVMIINIDAFKKSFSDTTKKSASNIIHRSGGDVSIAPIELIRETNPIVIIDEPQKVDTTDKSEKAIASLNPLCLLRYSATHLRKNNMVYRLDAVDSYNKGLVKKIEVLEFDVSDSHNTPYIRLESVDNKDNKFTAKVEIDYENRTKTDVNIVRKIVTVKKGDDLYEKSNHRSVYDNCIINDIYTGEDQYITLSNIGPVRVGKVIGGTDDALITRERIKSTIKEHFEKELDYRRIGVKVLSLFFLDRVKNYRENDEKGPYAVMFEEEYVKLLTANPKYSELLGGADPSDHAKRSHDGYFSGEKGGWKDTSGTTDADNSIYNAIMKDKEKLLSLTGGLKDLRFIFSHSALREGWDNPNVFQICTLREIKGETERRQTIGRGLRLCVNQDGCRIRDPNINRLTVIANESYEAFAKALQDEYETDCGIKFNVIEKHTFASIAYKNQNGETENIGAGRSEMLLRFFTDIGYTDCSGKIQDSMRSALDDRNLAIPKELEDLPGVREEVTKKCIKLAGSLNIRNSRDRKDIRKDHAPQKAQYFGDLWDHIKHKTTYRVKFDKDRLIDKCSEEIAGIKVDKPTLTEHRAELGITEGGVIADGHDMPLRRVDVVFDIPDIVAYLQNHLGLTRNTIIDMLLEGNSLNEFSKNPQEYMEEVIRRVSPIINKMSVEGIEYLQTDAEYSEEMFVEKVEGYRKDIELCESKNSLYDYIFYDSDIEMKFAKKLNNNGLIKLFVKLPGEFRIETPIGGYNPDWAILGESQGGKRHLYFVAETKGTNDKRGLPPNQRCKVECGEKHFGALKADVNYKVVNDADQIIMSELFFDQL